MLQLHLQKWTYVPGRSLDLGMSMILFTLFCVGGNERKKMRYKKIKNKVVRLLFPCAELT